MELLLLRLGRFSEMCLKVLYTMSIRAAAFCQSSVLLSWKSSDLMQKTKSARYFQVSAMWWDQNEEYSQFTGDHAFLYKGYSLLADALAEGLDIQLSEEVSRQNVETMFLTNII